MKIAIALELAVQLLSQLTHISALIQKAQAEGRDTLTDDELDAVITTDDAARGALESAIEQATKEGR